MMPPSGFFAKTDIFQTAIEGAKTGAQNWVRQGEGKVIWDIPILASLLYICFFPFHYNAAFALGITSYGLPLIPLFCFLWILLTISTIALCMRRKRRSSILVKTQSPRRERFSCARPSDWHRSRTRPDHQPGDQARLHRSWPEVSGHNADHSCNRVRHNGSRHQGVRVGIAIMICKCAKEAYLNRRPVRDLILSGQKPPLAGR